MDDEEEKLIPRNYQMELMKIAISQNTIIYLPTGSGKTFIAIMVLKHLSDSLSKPYNEGGKISCILVNSVTLVDQHAKYVRDHTIFTVGAYSGEMNLDFWKKEEWSEQFNKHQVVIMTSQILVNLINNSFIDLRKINLLIFDECHQGVEDQPMRQVMKNFQNYGEQPRILGLTATLLNGNCKLSKVMEEVKSLETTYHSKVATVDGLDEVVGYSTNPQELFKICKASDPSGVDNLVIARLERLIKTLQAVKVEDCSNNVNLLSDNLKPLEPIDVLKRLRNLISDLVIHIKMLGTFGGYKACLSYMIQVERIKKHCQDTVIFIVLNNVMTVIGWAKTVFKNAMKNSSKIDMLRIFSSDKVIKLFEILHEYKSKSEEELCCLIFVKRRFTAKIIHHILQHLREADQSFNHLVSNFVVGNNNNPYNDSRESLFISKKNREVLNSFVNKEINVLVSSNVLEEGVDIPKCTLVIKFDKSEDYRSYIQSKGRARHKKSLYYTILEQDIVIKFREKYNEFVQIEKILNELLIGKNAERESPNTQAINNMYNEDEFPPYYVNGPNSAQVNMTSAISLLCRYCTSLSNDQYTIYAPEWYLEKNELGIRVVILLPIVCPIIESIKGPFMRNKKNAKRGAALAACIKLHKIGELDDDLLPVRREFNEEDVSYLFEHWPKEKEGDAGNKKKKRLHDKEISESIKGKLQPDRPLYLHVIKLNPTYSRTEDFNQATIYDLYKTSLCFGILSPKPLPELCKFPVFDSTGTIEVDIKANVKQIVLTNNELMQLREFHYLIFNDLLEILKNFLIFDNNGTNSETLLVVPVQDAIDVFIDFDVVREHKTLKNKLEHASSERMNLQVNEETYLRKIVSPWYRTQPTMYVVTRVCIEKSPKSPFPNQEYSNFASYYDDKHSLRILNEDQPLLLVKGLSKKLNVFKPRGREGKRKKEKRYEELEEYLIPEFVIKQEFPSCLWIQARFLPSILSRLVYLLRIRQLQLTIGRDIGVKQKYLENCPPMQVDMHLLNYFPDDAQLAAENETTASSIESSYLPIELSSSLTQQYNKDFASKMLESDYSWKNLEEPKDIERDINVTVMDIEYYETFISQRASKQTRLLKNDSPLKNVPAITYNKEFEEKHLSVLEIQFDNQSPNLCSLYQALTAAEANDIVNLERLETLGDSFLKVIASLYILFKFPHYNEGKATTLKGKIVSNRNLFYLAVKKNLGGILKNNDFSPNDEWVPPCFCIPQALNNDIKNKRCSINSLFKCDVLSEEQTSGVLSLSTISREEVTNDEENSYPSMCSFLNKQYVSDKTLADSVEALLGAYFLNGGITGGVKFLEWIEILPSSENVLNLIHTTDINPVVNAKATSENILFHIPQWREIEKRLGYRFKNHAFLLQALTHSSYSPNRITQSYERLEFVGDAILDFLITCYIYEHCGYLHPGEVTDLRSALVNNNTFASLVVRCGFHKFLLMINSKLQTHIDKFADYLANRNYVIDDEVLILLEEEDLKIAEHVDVPKVLGDIFEALAGAVYLDSNRDLKTVWKVFYRIMWKEIDLFSKNVPKNIIRRLYECHTAYPRFSNAFETDNKKTMVSLQFMCEGRKNCVHGCGTNKALAKRAAAKIALRVLKM
ncbi:hypothetical protein Zmor_000970 [Zophobas morio]|uniref:Uncharacterized protein n=1 Tax=Zophobas morio TaxID=2755281 RepID=A0AA38IXL8_9CUCU|nr:hypothetical protein Zmor_000970 [Zophobas morio]